MSHRDDCPTSWEAEHEGRRTGHDGYHSRYSNPYSGSDGCPEASDAWDRGYRSGEYDREREEEEARHERRVAERRRQEAEQEDEWQAQQYLAEEADRAEAAHYQQEMEAQHVAEIADGAQPPPQEEK